MRRGIALAASLLIWTVGSAPATTAADRALGEYLSSECVTCHQLSGRRQGIPSIVGVPQARLVAMLEEYRTKSRNNPIMQTVAGKFSNEEIAALAAYFSSLKVAH